MSWSWLLLVLPPTALALHLWLVLRRERRAHAASGLEQAERAAASWAELAPQALVLDPALIVLAAGRDAAARLAPLEAEIRAREPAFRAATLPGLRLTAIHPALLAVRGSDEPCELVLEFAARRLGCRVRPLRHAGGGLRGYVAELRDLDAERAARDAHDQRERRREREALVLEALDAGLMLVDAELRIVSLNPALPALLAPAGAELVARLSRHLASDLVGAPLGILDGPGFCAAELCAADAPGAAPRSTLLVLGDRRLQVFATRLVAPDGRFAGVALRWVDRTEAARIEAEIQQVVGEVNRYNLVPRVPLAGSSSSLATLGAGVNQVADTMAGIVSTVTTLAREVSEAAAGIASGNAELGEQAARAARSLADTAGSTRGMTASLQQLTGNAHVASRLAAAMRASAVHGGEVVHDAREAMSRIEATARRMAAMVGSIDAIAFQTNLLAVNAAIEAAHAGPQGGGFGVVAGEVRALARRSKQAAQEVHAMIDETLRCVAAGSERVTQSELALGEIIESAKGVDEIIAEIDAVVEQQSGGIGQVEAAVLELERFTREHNALVARTSRASEALAEQSADLAGLMRRYKLPEVIHNAPKLRTKKRPDAAPVVAKAVSAAPESAISRLRVAAARAAAS